MEKHKQEIQVKILYQAVQGSCSEKLNRGGSRRISNLRSTELHGELCINLDQTARPHLKYPPKSDQNKKKNHQLEILPQIKNKM